MKTHAEAKPPVPFRANAAPAPNALAHQEQYRQAMRRAGVQPRLEMGDHTPQAKRVQRQEWGNQAPSGVPIFGGDFSGNVQLLNGVFQAKCQAKPEVGYESGKAWNVVVRLSAPGTGAAEQKAEVKAVLDSGKKEAKVAAEQESPSLWSRVQGFLGEKLLKTETGGWRWEVWRGQLRVGFWWE